MKNGKFHWLLREPKDEAGQSRWTVAKVAKAIRSNRSHVTDVLNNKPGHGGVKTRAQLTRFFRKHFRQHGAEILESLNWEKR